MSEPVITVRGLSKRYEIQHQGEKGDGLRHAIETAVRSPLAWLRSRRARTGASKEEFWALRDVSFEVQRGEVVGIIGRNGAGKSTLLKLLSRISEPTSGQIRLRGRVASLLEVGTGFHPELTGRENIFLNGAILGMSRIEIRRNFDAIVAFAEVERFLDTPVKRYSSGMYVRLAFAVAAHLEPEILIVDEVLAVGDAAFQKKCLGKMDEVAKHGRTVLFVSHNMPMIANLCQRGIMLRGGAVIKDGAIRDVINTYLSESANFSTAPLAERTDRSGSRAIIATKIDLLNANGESAESVMTGQMVTLRLHYRCTPGQSFRDCRAGIALRRGEHLYGVLSTRMVDNEPLGLQHQGWIDFTIPSLPLASGTYALDSFLESNELYDSVADATEIAVEDGDFFGTGIIRPSVHWQNVGVLIPHHYKVHREVGPASPASR